MENQMFCYQCQETAGCSGCTRVGVCGKQPDVAAMQDLLVYVTKGISAVTTTLRQEGVEIQPAVNHMITLNLFTTITNANFSKEAIIARIQETLSEKDLLLSKLTNKDTLPEAALWNGSVEEFDTKAAAVGVLSTENEDIRSLRELITYGLKDFPLTPSMQMFFYRIMRKLMRLCSVPLPQLSMTVYLLMI